MRPTLRPKPKTSACEVATGCRKTLGTRSCVTNNKNIRSRHLQTARRSNTAQEPARAPSKGPVTTVNSHDRHLRSYIEATCIRIGIRASPLSTTRPENFRNNTLLKPSRRPVRTKQESIDLFHRITVASISCSYPDRPGSIYDSLMYNTKWPCALSGAAVRPVHEHKERNITATPGLEVETNARCFRPSRPTRRIRWQKHAHLNLFGGQDRRKEEMKEGCRGDLGAVVAPSMSKNS